MTNELLLSNTNIEALQAYTTDLNTVVANLNHYIPQFSQFIDQIHAVQIKYNVILSEPLGSLCIDVPENMSEVTVEEVAKKIGVLDRLCLQRITDIESELSKARSLENLIKQQNPGYTSQISGQIAEFARLRGAFK